MVMLFPPIMNAHKKALLNAPYPQTGGRPISDNQLSAQLNHK
jgi:hypothetical protein